VTFQAAIMTSTPMAVDSPIAPNGMGLSLKPNGATGTPIPPTAKLTDMMPLYRPTKVEFSFQAL
jgi:COMPASS component SWD2